MSEEEMRKELEEKMRAYQAARNSAAVDDFRGLSPDQMHRLLHQPFTPHCILNFSSGIPNELLEEVPIMQFVLLLLNQLNEAPLKLTAKGNLPRKFVHALYDLRLYPESLYDSGQFRLNMQDEFAPAILVRYVPEIGGMTKVRKGKMSLTKKGEKLLAGKRELLYQELFLTYGAKFNFSYLHGDPEIPFLQQSIGFVLYLLHLDGKEWRKFDHYDAAYLRAFPHVVTTVAARPYSSPRKEVSDAVRYRLFRSFLDYFGLVRKRNGQFRGPPLEVMATDRFRRFFTFDHL